MILKSSPRVDLNSQQLFIPNLQIARALAAILVVLLHTYGALLGAGKKAVVDVWYLQSGVDVFFVISGFIMMHVERGSGLQQSGRFLKRRAIRIIPLYWIFTSVSVVYFIVDHQQAGFHLSQIRGLVASYLFWPHANVPGDKGSVAPVLGVGWTLNAEMFFYLIFSLSFISNGRILRPAIVISIIAALVLCHVNYDLPMPIHFWSEPIMIEFTFGIAISMFYERIMQVPKWILSVLMAFAALIFVLGTTHAAEVSEILDPYPGLWRPLCWGLPAACLVLCLVSIEDMSQSYAGKILAALGGASYSIYLSHTLFLDGFAGASRYFTRLGVVVQDTNIFAEWIVLFIVAIMIGTFVYQRIEVPITLTLRRRRWTFHWV